MSESLNIPSKSLDDNFKLLDFQKDFVTVLKMALSATAKPIKLDFSRMNELDVTYEDGRVIQLRFERQGQQISKVIDLTNNKITIIKWKG